jgi:hypothetical protein
MANAPFALNRLEDPNERLLPDIVDDVERVYSRSELDQHEFAEIINKMLFCSNVAPTETVEVGLIEGKEFHEPLKETGSIYSCRKQAQSIWPASFAWPSPFLRLPCGY